MSKIYRKVIVPLIICLLTMVQLAFMPVLAFGKTDNSTFEIKFIDVGQGDAALIKCDGHYMLIDGGPSNASSTIYSILKKEKIDKLDYMIATHPDADHIGGLSGALNYAKVEKCFCSVTQHDTKTFNSLLKYLAKQKVSITVPQSGDTFNLGGANITILGPGSKADDTNNSSIVVKVEYGNNYFLFMGDAEAEEEAQIINKWKNLKCDVIKIGHHGSASSTSDKLLKSVKPQYAIISVGIDNAYGHPDQSALDRLNKAAVEIYRTDQHGDITIVSDGKSIEITTEKNVIADNQKSDDEAEIPDGTTYVLNTNTKRFHTPTCKSVYQMKDKNREFTQETAEALISKGYKACGNCKPYTENNVADTNISNQNETTFQDNNANASAYVLNTKSKKFHEPTCGSVSDMSAKNRKDVNVSREEIIAMGYSPCKRCNP